jgi:Flp pilus assembly protein TadD
LDGAQVRIFAVVPDQTALEALLHRGIYQLDAGNAAEAKKLFQRVLADSPTEPRALDGLRAADAQELKDSRNLP